MKIVVGGSMTFAREQMAAKEELERKGFEVLITDNVEKYARDGKIKTSFEEELRLCLEDDVMMSFFKKIAESDTYLVMNLEKNGISGYLGASVLMEMGIAYYLNKKVFLFNPVDRNQGYAMEAAIINPVILDGDLGRIENADISSSVIPVQTGI